MHLLKEKSTSLFYILVTDRNILLASKQRNAATGHFEPQCDARLAPADVASLEVSRHTDGFALLKFATNPNAPGGPPLPPLFFHTNRLTTLLYGLSTEHTQMQGKIHYVEKASLELPDVKGFKAFFSGKKRTIQFKIHQGE